MEFRRVLFRSSGFRENQFYKERVLVRNSREAFRFLAWLHVRESDKAALRLRHDLLRDHEHVACLQPNSCTSQRFGKDFWQLIARLDLSHHSKGADFDPIASICG